VSPEPLGKLDIPTLLASHGISLLNSSFLWETLLNSIFSPTTLESHDHSQNGLVNDPTIVGEKMEFIGVSQRKLELRIEMPWLASRVGISGLPRGSGLTGRCRVRAFHTGDKGHESWGLMEP
jgi:hypothetical protein